MIEMAMYHGCTTDGSNFCEKSETGVRQFQYEWLPFIYVLVISELHEARSPNS